MSQLLHASWAEAVHRWRSCTAGCSAAGPLLNSCCLLKVMPFILRRTKDAVLKELPPKILQDVLVSPSPLQAALLDAFGQGTAAQAAAGALAQAGAVQDTADKAPHVFQVGAGAVRSRVAVQAAAELASSVLQVSTRTRVLLGTCAG